eukprot:scaffold181389_cov64-Attheya_sp.AAC.3
MICPHRDRDVHGKEPTEWTSISLHHHKEGGHQYEGLKRDLTARGETSSDILFNLFKGYAAVKDLDFKEYIKVKKSAYEDGTLDIEERKPSWTSHRTNSMPLCKRVPEIGPLKSKSRLLLLPRPLRTWPRSMPLRTRTPARSPSPTGRSLLPTPLEQMREMAISTHLWPYALRSANDSINHAPRLLDKVIPIEAFTGTQLPMRVRLQHTFGCPTYALNNKLQGGKSIPKWQERARVGIYLGLSPQHSRSVALVLSLTTGLVSPQFHVEFDDFFETVGKRAGNPIT